MRIFTFLTACCLTLVLSAQTTHLIETSGLNFVPNMLTIELGDVVMWRNTGQGFHNVNGTTTTYPDNPEGFSNGAVSNMLWEFEYTFTQPGTYTYQCDPHAGANMIGFITVNDNSSGSADLVISEIMYNPPEFGQDTYEYLEIYNNGDAAANLLGYSLEGVDYTFTTGMTLGAGEYLLMAGNATAFEAAFGLTAIEWTSGSLSNGGETIRLLDDGGAIVDSVDFDDSFPWPTTPDGFGPSLVLCDFNSDNNDAANWAAANTGTGFLSEGQEIFGNPGSASACPDGPFVRFLTNETEVEEAVGMFAIQVEISGVEAGTYTVDVELDEGASTATLGVDAVFGPTTLMFNSGDAVDTLEILINVSDDTNPESIESLVFNLVNASGDLNIDPINGTTTVLIADNDSNVSSIVINEIMYNPPGSDAMYEYLELLNNDDSPVDLVGYYFTAGIEDTLHNITLQPGEYVVLAVDSVAYTDAYGGLAWQWTNGALGNGGEAIELRDALGNVVDFVEYDDTGDWDEDADGTGSSLVLCDPNSDNNLGASWIAGTQSTDIFISGLEILGSPGAMNDCTPVEPEDYTPYAIGIVTTVDDLGNADSLGVRAELTGVVYGVNLRPSGAQFTIIDAAGDGIGLFNFDNDFGYTITEGDEVTVQGVIGQFNGLTQLNLDTIIFNSMGNALVNPTVVTDLNEETESQLVTIEGVNIVEIVTAGGGLNVTMSDGVNTYLIRADFDTGITEEDFNITPATTFFNITGLGGQFDNSEPYDEGYQLLPRYVEDIDQMVSTSEPIWAQGLDLFPNPVTNQLTIRSTVNMEQMNLQNELGQTLRTWRVAGTQNVVELSDLPAGIYFLQLQAEGELVTRRIVKQ